MQFDDGRTCAFHTDAQKAAQWLQVCDGNRVQEYVKLERLQNALSGNSPVSPGGWISCSERMPNDKQYVWCWGSLTAGLSAIPSKGITIGRETNGGQLLTMRKNRHRK